MGGAVLLPSCPRLRLPTIRQRVRTHRLHLYFRNSLLTAHLPVEPRAPPSKIHHVRLLLFHLSVYCFRVVDVLLVEQEGFAPSSINLSVCFIKSILFIPHYATDVKNQFGIGRLVHFAKVFFSTL